MRQPDPADVAAQVRRALAEDVGAGDLTAALVPADAVARAEVIVREPAVLCGSAWFEEVFRQLDAEIRVDWSASDGAHLVAGQRVCTVQGMARPVLSGERTALNFLQTLSGTASRAAQYVAAVAGTQATVLDTRKTLPGLRLAQKYAVRCGGASNHRVGLFDAVLIKENHIRAAGSIAAALRAAQAATSGDVMIEIEVEDLAELGQALGAGATRILLDNFSLAQLREAVLLTAGRAELEASGGVSLESVREIALSGVDYISVGQLTKDVRATDYSMLFPVR
ncbi:MAG: carboxylating nicotinate-nucleotide diphosphorylase [Gammaproteobacteria bacterium]|mgnify:FL=1|nr:carboxylating nicotinate-nucleotide diphosphorylase [Gammaproteobacteria bacterium]MCP5318951.1 carboxylating nicotinate-nucleotide diphosphorylase [Chromatiaceae bacterium]MCW5586331.1 carboxylating nicotinate-nucleotide diphosphorylase [Chromatiales bacterium]MCB1818948.1 carboxylating nicotinate-nucleotide diphosphorylase [Gammaproteobacteria bacterium]MCP5431316.1 carboxylating nicotinate-nucleotide diphosphorylase [Chromatiaceae bacterium]